MPERLRRRFGVLLGIGLLATAAAGCGGATRTAARNNPIATNPPRAVTPAIPPPAPVAWSRCKTNPELQCGSVSVPVDYARPDAGSITLAVTRARALDGSGTSPTLVFNPGGPGESGNQILPVVLAMLPVAVRRHFNIVSFDPRGTGASDPLQCGTPPWALTSLAPVPPPGQPLEGTAVYAAMARSCLAKAPSTEPYIDTFDTARDMDRIRQALGLSTISFYGLSYGTVLGAVYADLFPTHVSTMVLDGAVDVNGTLTQQAEEEAPAEEQSLLHLFAVCHAMARCPMGADPQAFFTSLAASLARHPLKAPGGRDNSQVTVGDLDTATLFALSVPGFTPSFYEALTAAAHGDGVPLRSMALLFVDDLDGAPLVDALWAITCNDAPEHPGQVAAGNLARALDARYPLIGAYSVTYTMGGCVFWPRGLQPVSDLHPTRSPPVLVIGNTGDPNTPITEARQLAAIFPSASMLTWKGWGHTWLLSGSSDPCMKDLVTKYLLGGGLPPPGTVCD
jgi:pimeloyl-ACP methyl ester carboxylesterase